MRRAAAPLLLAATLAAAAAPRPQSPEAALAAAAAPTAQASEYLAEPCCRLCPRAADPDAYEGGSKTLSDFRMLVDGRSGWLFRTGLDLTTSFDIPDDSLPDLHRLVEALHARGTELLLVYQPPRGLMDVRQLTDQQQGEYNFQEARRAYTAALARLRSTGAIVPPLEKLADQPHDYDYFFRRDHHWTPAGAEHTAQIVADEIRSLPLYADLPRRAFKTHPAGIIGKPGTLQKIAQQLCGGAWSLQYLPAFATDPADEGGGGLLGEEAVPSITLVGTSNSDSKGGYNFSGYLEQALGADVLNVAITGGSFVGSLLHYLPSENFQKHPPKLLIWEMPYQDYPGSDKNPHKPFRQAIPLVNDGCRNHSLLMSKTLALKAGSNETLFNGGGPIAPLLSRRMQLDLQFSDPSVQLFTGTIWYFNGMKEHLKLEFKPYVDNAGRFVAELRTDTPEYASATMMALTIELEQPPPKPLTVTANLCAH